MSDTGTTNAPASPADLDKRSWFYVARKTAREFSKDECTDIAAALTYYAVLALFPALIALLSVVGLVGQTEETVDTLLGILDDVGAASVAETLRPTIEQLASSQSAGFALIIGLATALWSASGYVSAFGRALNRMYETPEGRPFWKFRPIMIVVTAVVLVLVAMVALALVLTGPAAQAVGDAIGLGSTAVTLWNWLKWPVMLFVVVVIVALLYWATPNVKQPKFRWLSVGAVFAILVWILASLAFGFYVANFSSYNRTYGALAGVIVFLLWLWLTNIALLFGAELDSELERGRELEAGLPAERNLQLPPRDTTKIEKDEKKQAKDIEKGREIREQHARAAAQDTSNGDGKAP
jgi:membrane protein